MLRNGSTNLFIDKFWLIMLLLLLALIPACLLYYPVSGYELVWDDIVIRNERNDYYSGLYPLGSSLIHSLGIGPYYRPLPAFTMEIESRLFGIHDGPPAHVFNVMLMMCNSLLVGILALLRAQGSDRARLVVGVCATLFFSLHPALMSCYAFVSTRFDVMMALFLLLYFLVEKLMEKGMAKSLLKALLVFCAVCSKEYAIWILAVMMAWKLHQFENQWQLPAMGKQRWKVFLNWMQQGRDMFVGIAAPIFLYTVIRFFIPVPEAVVYLPMTDKWSVAKVVYSFGLLGHLMVLPHDLVSLLVFSPDNDSVNASHALTGWLLAVCVLMAGLRYKVISRVTILLGIVLLLPFSNLVLGLSNMSLVWPWYLLFPMALAFTRFLPDLAGEIQTQKSITPVVAVVMLVWLLAGAWQVHNNLDNWRNDKRFCAWWMHSDPLSAEASLGYLRASMRHDSFEQAYETGLHLLENHPLSAALFLDMSELALHLGYYEKANEYALKAINRVTLKNEYGNLLAISANIQLYLGDSQSADALLKMSEKFRPNDWYLEYVKLRYCIQTKDVAAAQYHLQGIQHVLGENPEVRLYKLKTIGMDETEITRVTNDVMALMQQQK